MKLNIGDNIRIYRKKADMTQEQLADKLGVSYQSVSRWENGSTYPDMELLPSLSKIFNISVDELLGIPDDKKEQAAKDTFMRLAQASFETPVDIKKVNELIRDIRKNYLDSKNFWHFWLSVKNSIYQMPEVLPEVRLTVEAILDSNAEMCPKNEAIAYMAKYEDDEHVDKFLERYASERDLTKNSLLSDRYHIRGDWSKNEPLRQLFLFQHIDQLTGNVSLWQNFDKPKRLDESILRNNLQLNLLHNLCAQVPDEKHPISGNGEVDLWIEPRLWMGFRKACYLASTGDSDNAFIVLEDTVSLLEKAMQITSPIELRCTSSWLDLIIWTAEEDWNNPGGSPILANEEERLIWIHNADSCFCLYPSLYKEILTAESGWEWFDPIRHDPRFNEYINRLNTLVITRPKKIIK